MVGSMGPVVDGAKPAARRVAMIHGVGLLIGAAVMALALSALGSALSALGFGVLPLVLVVAAASAAFLQVFGVRPIQSHWQVPERWRRLVDIDVLAAFYGFLLGLGVLTAVVASAFWVFVGLTLVVAPTTALAGWAVYALARSIGFWVIARTLDAQRIYLAGEPWRRLVVAAATATAASAVASHLLGFGA